MVRKQALICPNTPYPNFSRYIPNRMRFNKAEAKARKKRSHVAQHAKSEFWRRFPSKRHAFGVATLFCDFLIESPDHISQTLP